MSRLRRSLPRPLSRRSLLTLSASVPLGAIAAWALWDRWRVTPVAPPPPLTAPARPLRVYHLGHSLVGADIPHLLAQFAGSGHRYNKQLGSGTSLRAHWTDGTGILHFDLVNHAPIWRDPREAIDSGDYDAVILTEMVELRDAIRYFDSPAYLHRWASLAREGNRRTRLYLYETWHPLDDPKGWLERIDGDLEALWLGSLMAEEIRHDSAQPFYLIPGGQVLAAVTRAAEAGLLPGITRREDLFARNDDGSLDQIHLSPLGAYIIALTHYAVLYHRSPVGMPRAVTLADGTPFTALATVPEAEALQTLIWQVVTHVPHTGVAAAVRDARAAQATT